MISIVGARIRIDAPSSFNALSGIGETELWPTPAWLRLLAQSAPVAQWIEHRFPKP